MSDWAWRQEQHDRMVDLMHGEAQRAELRRVEEERARAIIRKREALVSPEHCTQLQRVEVRESGLPQFAMLPSIGPAPLTELAAPLVGEFRFDVAEPTRPSEERASLEAEEPLLDFSSFGVDDLDTAARARHDAIRMTDRTKHSPTYTGTRTVIGIVILAAGFILGSAIGGEGLVNSDGYMALIFGAAIVGCGVLPAVYFQSEWKRNVQASKMRSQLISEERQKAKAKSHETAHDRNREVRRRNEARAATARARNERAEARYRRELDDHEAKQKLALARYEKRVKAFLVSCTVRVLDPWQGSAENAGDTQTCVCGSVRYQLVEITTPESTVLRYSPECWESLRG